MAITDLNTFDVLNLKSIKVSHYDKAGQWLADATFKPTKKGEVYIVLLLGMAMPGEAFDPEAALNAAGWNFVAEPSPAPGAQDAG